MNTIAQWGYNLRPFNLTCSHCLKQSKSLPWGECNGQPVPHLIEEMFKFKLKVMDGGTAVMCSNWCKWRHGKSKGIHRLLNFIGHKSNAYKQ